MGAKCGRKKDDEEDAADRYRDSDAEDASAGQVTPKPKPAPKPAQAPKAYLSYTHCDYFEKFWEPKSPEEEFEVKKIRLHTTRSDVRRKLCRAPESIGEMREAVRLAETYGDAAKGLVNFELGKLLLWADTLEPERERGTLTREALSDLEDSKFLLLLEIPDDAQGIERVEDRGDMQLRRVLSNTSGGSFRQLAKNVAGSLRVIRGLNRAKPESDGALGVQSASSPPSGSRASNGSVPSRGGKSPSQRELEHPSPPPPANGAHVRFDAPPAARPTGNWFRKDAAAAPRPKRGRRESLAKVLAANNPTAMGGNDGTHGRTASVAAPTYTPRELQQEEEPGAVAAAIGAVGERIGAVSGAVGHKVGQVLNDIGRACGIQSVEEDGSTVPSEPAHPDHHHKTKGRWNKNGQSEKDRTDYLHLKLCNLLETLADTYWMEMRRQELGSSLRKHYLMQAERSRKSLISELAQIHGAEARLIAPQWKCLADFHTEVFNFAEADAAFRQAAKIEQGQMVRGLSVLWKDRLDKAKMQDREERAAVRVQAMFRAWLDRRMVKEMKKDNVNLRRDPLAMRRVLPFCRTCGEKQGGKFCAGCGDRLVMR
eukprot:TRINITY_DN6261_c2_g4_i1.p1 TRINITY_DN6261_c2_g4~~TRINITY_DN6261_c2_g4_i1.p1  ORF type:complete len:597 (+),score=174.61 TRINITY_DN6261_c2_g4_i1:150-1940(+)